MARWTSRDIPSMDGKVAVVTGANSGLGLEASVLLARAGARVILACRSRDKAERAAARVGPFSQVVTLDLASLESVRAAAAAIRERTSQIDVLINNAGLMAVNRSRTKDGFETQLGVNHLGHFALTSHLAEVLAATAGSRVVTVSSMGARLGSVDFDDLMFEKRDYDRWKAYFQSKLANLLFAFELERRLRAAGAPTQSLAAHPGSTRTDLGQEGSGILNRLLRPLGGFGQPVGLGVLPIVRAAVDPAVRGGEYYGPQLVVAGYPVRETPSRRARDEAAARRLWERSEELTGVRFEVPASR